MDKNKVCFKHLSIPLKIAVISSYIVGAIYAIAILVGMVVEIIRYLNT